MPGRCAHEETPGRPSFLAPGPRRGPLRTSGSGRPMSSAWGRSPACVRPDTLPRRMVYLTLDSSAAAAYPSPASKAQTPALPRTLVPNRNGPDTIRPLCPVDRRRGGPRSRRPLRTQGTRAAVAPHGRRGVVAARGLRQDRRGRLHGCDRSRRLRRRRHGPVRLGPGLPGLRALESGHGAVLGGARQPVRQQHLPQRQRRTAQKVPARPVQRHADRRARA